jgi:hypothetical protein
MIAPRLALAISSALILAGCGRVESQIYGVWVNCQTPAACPGTSGPGFDSLYYLHGTLTVAPRPQAPIPIQRGGEEIANLQLSSDDLNVKVIRDPFEGYTFQIDQGQYLHYAGAMALYTALEARGFCANCSVHGDTMSCDQDDIRVAPPSYNHVRIVCDWKRIQRFDQDAAVVNIIDDGGGADANELIFDASPHRAGVDGGP